ncbi:MAG: DUF4190 domain-containing protein [Limisphaerales bacterium]
MAQYHFIGGDGKPYGPYTLDQMKEHQAANRLNAESQISVDGGGWKPASSILEIFGNNAAATGSTAPVQYPQVTTTHANRTNPMAITGMICGIISLPAICCCYGFPFHILGIIFSMIGLSQIKKSPGEQGKGMAIAGLICAILSIILVIAFIVLGVAVSASDLSGRP